MTAYVKCCCYLTARFGSSVSKGFPCSSVGKDSACNAGDPSLIPGTGRFLGGEIGYLLQYSWASLVAQLVKSPPAMWETWVRTLGWENPLEKGKATPHQYSGLENSMDCIVHGVSECDMAEQLSLSLSLKAEFETCDLRSGCSSGNNNTGGMKQGRKGNTDQGWASDSV